MKNDKKMKTKRLLSITLAIVVAFTFMPFLDSRAYAASGNTKKSIKNANEKLKYVEKLPGGKTKTLDPEIFEGDGTILNPDDATLKELGIGVEPEPSGEIIEVSNAESIDNNEDAYCIPSMRAAGMEVPDSNDAITEDKELMLSNEKEGSDASSDTALLEQEKADANEPSETEPLMQEENINAKNVASETVTEKIGEAENQDSNTNSESEGKTITTEDLRSQDKVIGVAATPWVAFSTNLDYPSGKLKVSGTVKSGYYISRCRVYNLTTGKVYYDKTASGKTQTRTWTGIDVTSYPIGVYIAELYYRDTGDTINHTLLDMGQFSVSVYNATPSSSGSVAVYSSYMDYLSPTFDYAALSSGYSLYMDCGSYVALGPMSYVQSKTISGLAPNSNYGVSIYYGIAKNVNVYEKINGSLRLISKTLLFSGRDTGRVRGIGTFRTGIASLPKIKSVKVKAYKVKKRKAGVYGWYTGYYFGSVKYYTYKIKVTVEFKTKKKKKPGIPGLYVNGVWKPGNKKKYTLKLGPYANYTKPKGKKFNVYLYTAHAPGSYGGYSPMVAKRKKVK